MILSSPLVLFYRMARANMNTQLHHMILSMISAYLHVNRNRGEKNISSINYLLAVRDCFCEFDWSASDWKREWRLAITFSAIFLVIISPVTIWELQDILPGLTSLW